MFHCQGEKGFGRLCHAEFISASLSERIGESSDCPVKHKGYLKKSAFTLAEVLITLGIIGVVAAMTIPTLVANAKSHQYRSSFKKAVATLSQAAKMSQAQYDFDYATISGKCGANAGTENPENVQTVCSLLNGTLTGATFYENPASLKMKNGSNYSITAGPLMKINGLSVASFKAYSLSDGTLILVYKPFGDYPCTLNIGQKIIDDYGADAENMNRCLGLIDVNGISPPNKEVSCSSGSDSLSQDTCIVKNDPKHLTDVYPIRFHDQTVEPASAAARYVLKN